MSLITGTKDITGKDESVCYDSTPDDCPRCNRSVHPKLITAVNSKEKSIVQLTFQCTSLKCEELFIATYIYANRSEQNRRFYRLESVAPLNTPETKFPDTIQRVSPSFVSIFNQVAVAESMELAQLVGIGLRKALEFLIKDFAVLENPDKSEDIRKTLLGSCITKYVTDPNVNECSKRAVWLGNDETHYTRKWETKDIKDLKILVHLTVNWIDSALLTKKYIDEMDVGKA